MTTFWSRAVSFRWAFQGNNLLVQADQGFVRGRGILALNFDFGGGITSFVQGDVYGGAHLFGAGGKAGSATSGDGSRHRLVAKAVYEIAMRLACVIAHPV